MERFIICFLALLVVACSKDEASDSKQNDLLIGTWMESSSSVVVNDGTDEFFPYDDYCTLQSRFIFNKDGSFKVETFDGTQNDCFSTGVTTGTWENQGESYNFKIISDTSDTSDEGSSANITIQFPDSDTMRWIFNPSTQDEGYTYEEYTRVN
ncbi:lipocalin family protein [Allomuricauda sp. F6463D]|uniref:lipocalin family protein n=1 Tax=Allomuricauda sp. F6463D TaxID=2926409 RepID=UPI001FF5A463|nr:lipocalin family protein [Muricauda sp. F6463D]MCK0161693.1 lipocalin family protein [Muricauda sp. F6463D]